MKKPWSYVTVDASVLSDEWVYNALIWADAIQETTEFLKQVMERGYFTLTEIVKEDHHPFGPALALSGSRGDIEVLIPWHAVRSIVHSPVRLSAGSGSTPPHISAAEPADTL